MIEPNGLILRISKPYEGRVHDFKIRQSEGPLPTVPILADSGYQGLQNEHSAAVILPKKKPQNGSLSTSDQARNTKLARCRIFKHPENMRNFPLDCYIISSSFAVSIFRIVRTYLRAPQKMAYPVRALPRPPRFLFPNFSNYRRNL